MGTPHGRSLAPTARIRAVYPETYGGAAFLDSTADDDGGGSIVAPSPVPPDSPVMDAPGHPPGGGGANRMRSARITPKSSPTPPPTIAPNAAVHSGSSPWTELA